MHNTQIQLPLPVEFKVAKKFFFLYFDKTWIKGCERERGTKNWRITFSPPISLNCGGLKKKHKNLQNLPSLRHTTRKNTHSSVLSDRVQQKKSRKISNRECNGTLIYKLKNFLRYKNAWRLSRQKITHTHVVIRAEKQNQNQDDGQ